MTEQERLDQLAHHYHEILSLLGEDPQREGLLKTPTRVAKSMTTLTAGQNMDPIAVLNSAKFTEEQRQMVLGARHRVPQSLRAPHAPLLR